MTLLSQISLDAQAIALMFSAGIFLLILGLILTRRVNLPIAALLLFFCILSGVVIANHDLFRGFLRNKLLAEEESSSNVNRFKKEILIAVDELKAEWEIHKHNMQDLMEEVHEQAQAHAAETSSNTHF